MMKNRNFGNITDLLDEKNISPAKRRRILAAAAALDLIDTALNNSGSQHKLEEELARLPQYTAAIEALLKID